MKHLLFIFLLIFIILPLKAVEFTGNPQIAFPQNNTFKVEIKRNGGNWETLLSHNAKIFWATKNMSFAKFEDDFTSPVQVRVTKQDGKFSKAEIRPKSYFIDYVKESDNVISFTLTKAQKVSVEFDGDRWNNLFLYADSLETTIPDKTDPNVFWYGPGVHNVGKITLTSNQTLYLHPDALVYGYIYITDATNIKILGQGILDSSNENMDYAYPRNSQLFIANSSDILIQNVILRNTPTWNLVLLGCNNVHIDGIKEIGSNANSDGLDIVSCSNVLIENTMQRNKDDNISIKGFNPAVDNKLDGMPTYIFNTTNVTDCYNITMRNCVLWADEAHNMLVGPDLKGRKAYNINFENIDVLENTQNDDVYPGVMAAMIADQGEYSDIHWNNIRIEDIKAGQILSLTYQNAYAMLGYGKSLKNVSLNNISYNGINASKSRILGLNATQNIDGVNITNYRINGVKAIDATTANMTVNGFTSNILFNAGSSLNPNNVLPITRNSSISQIFNTAISFKYGTFADLFSYVDPLSSIGIATLPTHGSLKLNNISVQAGDQIDASQLANLQYIPDTNFTGDDQFTWKAVCDGVMSNISTMAIKVKGKNVVGVSVGKKVFSCTSLTGFSARSVNLTIDASNAGIIDGYTRVNRTTDTEEFIIVKNIEDIHFFDVLVYGYGATGAEGLLKFYVSNDSISWSPVASNSGIGTQTTANSGWYRKHCLPVESIQAGARFLKVVFNISGNSWGTQLAEINLGTMNSVSTAGINTPLLQTGHPINANLSFEDGSIESIAINWDNGTPAFDMTKAGVYNFSGNISLPTAYTYSGSLIAKSTITLTDILNGMPPLVGTDDFMGRNQNGKILYSDDTLVPDLISNLDDGKTVKVGLKKFHSVGNMVNDGPYSAPGWKLKTEALQDRYCHFQRNNQSDSYVAYVVNESSNFEVELLNVNNGDNLKSSVDVQVSENGTVWYSIDYSLVKTETKTAGNSFYLFKAQVVIFPKATKLVRVVLKNGLDNLPPWAPQIIAVSSNAVTNIVSATNSNFQYTGRIDNSTPEKPDFIWSGTSVKVNFNGTKISGLFGATNGKIAVYVDSVKQSVQNITTPLKPIEITGLSAGNHEVLFRKVSRAENGRISFQGVICDGTIVSPSPRRSLKIEFFGNSVSEGYAAAAPNEANRDNGTYDDNSSAYTCLVAEKLKAEYHNTVMSGIAVSDGAGWLPFGMESRYKLLDPYNTSSLWDFSNYKPSICIMALGINDTYKDGGITGSVWRLKYKKLVLNLLAQYGPDTKFVFSIPPMIGASSMAVTNSIILVNDLKSQGINAFQHTYNLPVTGGHPIASEHIAIANELYAFLNESVLTSTNTALKTLNLENSFSVVGQHGCVVVKATFGCRLHIVDCLGRIIYNKNLHADNISIPVSAGIFIVNIDGVSQKVVVN